MKISLLSTLVLLSGLMGLGPSQSQIILGILEDVPGVYEGESDVRAVRVAFIKRGEDWQAFPSDCLDIRCLKAVMPDYPEGVSWTIAFDGRDLGQIVSRTRNKVKFYAHAGLQDIISTSSVPTIGKKSEMYGGFGGSAVYRPLVANSRPYFKDPERWKPGRLAPDQVAAVRARFREIFPKVKNCKDPNENLLRPWQYHDENIKVTKVYSSLRNWNVVQTVLESNRCDGPADPAFVDHWFTIPPDGHVKFVGKNMWLVDAGDYDNDGRSEIMFAIAGYNIGGYELFYDDFNKHATFEFHSH